MSYFKLSVQSLIVESEGLELKRWPFCQLPPFASFWSFVPLSPKPDEAEVQKGITVLLEKSLALTNVSTGHAAIPHQIG